MPAERISTRGGTSPPKALRARRIQSKKRLENALQLIRGNALARVVNLDANAGSEPSAADENTPTGRGMVDGVASQIAQDPTQQHGLAHDHRAGPDRTVLNPFAPRGSL